MSAPVPAPCELLALQLAAYWPVWRWYAARLGDGSDEPWGLLALGTVFVLMLMKARPGTLSRTQQLIILVLALAYLLSYGFVPPLVRALAAIAAMGITISPLLRCRVVHPGVCGLLILSLPVIASLQFYLGYPLRLLTASLAAEIVSLTGFRVAAHGTCLEWLGDVVAVDAPCAGIRMLWSGLYLTFTLACFTNLSSLATWLAYSFSTVAIFSGNLLRAVLLFYSESHIVTLPAWGHSAIGVLSFTLVAFLIVACNRTLLAFSWSRA